MPNGIIIIDKPEGWTSMDVCAKLRNTLRETRVGHAGTLDPMATGVLPIFVGRATRAVEFANSSNKEYVAGLKLGLVTNTQDTTGEVLEQHAVSIAPTQVEAALESFRGDILQLPPMYSAIKINGKKLYELARKGREVARAPRPVSIYTLALEGQIAPDEYRLRVRCSKGTYVRTLCHDIGAALGCGGCMSRLRRTAAAGFTLDDAVTLDTLLGCDDPTQLLFGVDRLFENYPALTLDPADVRRIRNGVTVRISDVIFGTYRVYAADGSFLALCQAQNGLLTTVKSFFEP